MPPPHFLAIRPYHRRRTAVYVPTRACSRRSVSCFGTRRSRVTKALNFCSSGCDGGGFDAAALTLWLLWVELTGEFLVCDATANRPSRRRGEPARVAHLGRCRRESVLRPRSVPRRSSLISKAPRTRLRFALVAEDPSTLVYEVARSDGDRLAWARGCCARHAQPTIRRAASTTQPLEPLEPIEPWPTHRDSAHARRQYCSTSRCSLRCKGSPGFKVEGDQARGRRCRGRLLQTRRVR